MMRRKQAGGPAPLPRISYAREAVRRHAARVTKRRRRTLAGLLAWMALRKILRKRP